MATATPDRLRLNAEGAPPVKALTIRQPWAGAIVHGTKRTENRTRRTNHRGLILIHAGLAEDRSAHSAGLCDDWPDVRGAVIGTARISDCHEATHDCCAPWGFPGAWHWTLYDIRAIPVPVPCRGQLGLWTPEQDVWAAVQRRAYPPEVTP